MSRQRSREHRKRPQRAEQPARPGRVGDREIQAVLAGDFEVDQRGIEPADLHHVDDEVGPASASRRSVVASIVGEAPSAGADLAAQGRPDLQPLRVDVHVAEAWRCGTQDNERMSPVRFLEKTTLPAPIMATLITTQLLAPWDSFITQKGVVVIRRQREGQNHEG